MALFPLTDDDMMNNIPQGWQCPVCKRIYNPSIPTCHHCNKQVEAPEQVSTGHVPLPGDDVLGRIYVGDPPATIGSGSATSRPFKWATW